MNRREPGPVDLMLMDRMNDATRMYLDFYLEALESGDRYIGADLVTQMHFSVAGKIRGRDPESVTDEVKKLVLDALLERGIDVDRQIVADDLAIAKKVLETGRKRSERSIEQMDRDRRAR